jgi:hypothetical protein
MTATSSPGIKLWVDDIRVAPTGWVLARTITEAIRMLALLRVTEISLDHDIAYFDERGSWTGKNSAENFTPVAWFIRILPANDRPHTVYLHTSNQAGADTMRSILENHVECVVRDETFRHEWGSDPLVRK